MLVSKQNAIEKLKCLISQKFVGQKSQHFPKVSKYSMKSLKETFFRRQLLSESKVRGKKKKTAMDKSFEWKLSSLSRLRKSFYLCPTTNFAASCKYLLTKTNHKVLKNWKWIKFFIGKFTYRTKNSARRKFCPTSFAR